MRREESLELLERFAAYIKLFNIKMQLGDGTDIETYNIIHEKKEECFLNDLRIKFGLTVGDFQKFLVLFQGF